MLVEITLTRRLLVSGDRAAEIAEAHLKAREFTEVSLALVTSGGIPGYTTEEPRPVRNEQELAQFFGREVVQVLSPTYGLDK